MIRLRHTNELVGLLVLLAILALLGAILEAGFVGRWFRPTSTLRIVLPSTGAGGLEAGDNIEVLGTHAGTVHRIVINPDGGMYAVAEIDNQIRTLIPRDSKGLIRRSFGIAGAAYVDIQRSTGPPMDWSYAVINATTERAPTESISAFVDEAREKIFPILTDAGQAAHSLASLINKVERGEGDAGRVLTDQTLMRNAEAALVGANDAVQTLNHLLARLDEATLEADSLVKSARDGKTGLPALLRQADRILADIRPAMRGLNSAAIRAPAISRNIEETSEELPALLLQTQAAAAQLEKLLTQLRGLWLLGGGDSISPEQRRLAPTQARP
jgi:phospholipid/cholesterol/gamma-HCH transport system substrate-binding protein